MSPAPKGGGVLPTHFAVGLKGEEKESPLRTMTPSVLDTMAELAKLALSKSVLGPFRAVFLTDTYLSGRMGERHTPSDLSMAD